MSDIAVLLFLVFVLTFCNIAFIMFDRNICPEVSAQEYNFTTEFNTSDETVYEDIKDIKCEGVPTWFQILFNAPFLLGIGLIIKKYVLI